MKKMCALLAVGLWLLAAPLYAFDSFIGGVGPVSPQTIAVTTEQDLTLTSALVFIGGDNDSNNDTIDLQNGSAIGQIVTFIGVDTIDSNDTMIFNYGDTTCTNCPACTFDKPGENMTVLWTGTTWVVIAINVSY